ncbi:MAG: hypothetical protein J6W64_04090, partial [Bacilli bacterium]|nr:hypothetical protein [Bacilli bacterium]
MAIKIIDAIKQKHILSLVDKTVEKGNLMSFYHIINTRNLDIHSPEILSRLNKIMKNKAFTINSTDFVALDRLKLDAETILNNPELRTTFINYYTGELLSEVDIFYMDIVRHVELFKQLIKDETFKAELCTRVDITKVGDRFFGEDAYLRYLEPEIRGTLTDNIEILRSLGYKFEKEKMKKLMLRSESNQQILLMLGLVDQKDIGDLYKYKFEVLKEWFKNGSPEPMPNIPIDHYIYKETPDNPMANYWNKLSRKLSFDPMEFVFRII